MRCFALRHLAVLALVGVSVAGCEDDPLSPFDPEVNNATDSFQLQATGVSNLSTTLNYTWRNSGTVANVNHSTTTSGGSARLVVRSPSGTVLYDMALVPSLNEQTSSGPAGDWTVQVILANYSGTLNVRLERP